MKLMRGQTLTHACGLKLHHDKIEDMVFPNDLCPQCGGYVNQITDISGGIAIPRPVIVKWTLHPPSGMRFVNEFANEVSLQFEQGREEEVFMTLQNQLTQHMNDSLRARQKREKDTLPSPDPMQLAIDTEGNITNQERH